MNILESIILGVVQGLTEFLPVSSSGHLVLTEKLLGLTTHNIRFVVVVHLGSLLAVLAVYRVQVGKIIMGLYKGRVRYRKGKWKVLFWRDDRESILPAVLGWDIPDDNRSDSLLYPFC